MRALSGTQAAPRARAPRMAPDARREQILQCALRCFSARGIGATRHSDIAQAAGVALPTVFHYFPQREDLVDAVLAEIARFLLVEIADAGGARGTAGAATEAIADVLLRFDAAIDSHPDYVRVWLEWSVAIRDGLWQSYLAFYRGALDVIAEMLARGRAAGELDPVLDIADAARVIVGLAHMIVQMRLSGASREQVTRTVHSLVAGYLRKP